jgi:hypothetical protein
MSGFWIMLVLWAGACAGFLAFALMQVAHDADRGQGDADPSPYITNDAGR